MIRHMHPMLAKRARFDADFMARLETGEQAVAKGTCYDVTEQGDGTGVGLCQMIVTDRRVLWTPAIDFTFLASLPLVDIETASETTVDTHRYVIRLSHEPLDRPRHAPAHNLLLFEWGNKVVVRRFRTTGFRFSRRDTAAAKAMRAELSSRGVFERRFEIHEG